MLIVYIFLGVIFVLFLVLFIVVIIRLNTKKVRGELEYLSENYEIEQYKDETLTYNAPNVYNYKMAAVMQAQQNQIAALQSQIQALQSQNQKSPEEIELERQKIREQVEKNNAPVVSIPLPEMKDEEIIISNPVAQPQQQEVVVTPNPNDEITIPGVNAPEPKVEEIHEEEIEILGSDQLQEDGEEIEVLDFGTANIDKPVVTVAQSVATQPPLNIQKITYNQTPIGTVNATEKAFGAKFDGNTTINKNIVVEEPKQQSLSYKTEIIDLSEVREILNNEKN